MAEKATAAPGSLRTLCIGLSSACYTGDMLTQPRYQTILFDLDGTLTDPAEGITRCIAAALEQLGAAVPDTATLCLWIGPPLRESFAAYLRNPAMGDRALALYRERFAHVGIFENRVYEGIPALLADLQMNGCRLLVASAKPLLYVQRILEHFDLAPYFTAVGGASLDDHLSTKESVIESLRPYLRGVEDGTCVMVGDREHDVYGAHQHQIPCIAVSYGYGTWEELAACGPEYIVNSVAELRAVLIGTGES